MSSAVTQPKIADNSVTSSKILNLSVNSDKLASDSVTAHKLANNAVTREKISLNAVRYYNADFLEYINMVGVGNYTRVSIVDIPGSVATVYLSSGLGNSYVVLIVYYNDFTIISSYGDFLDNWFIEKVENGYLYIIKRVGISVSQIICSISGVRPLTKFGYFPITGEKTSLRNELHLPTYYNAQGFKKSGSDDSKILLGGGSDKPVSDFAVATKYTEVILSKLQIEDLHNTPILLDNTFFDNGEYIRIIPEKCSFICDSDGSQFLGTSDILFNKTTSPPLGMDKTIFRIDKRIYGDPSVENQIFSGFKPENIYAMNSDDFEITIGSAVTVSGIEPFFRFIIAYEILSY